MAKKPTVTTVASGYYGRQALNDNFEALRDAFDNTLSRDGSTPNAMGADLDMNSNDILNAQTVNTESLRLDGILVGSSDLSAAGATLYSDNYTGDGTTVAYTMSYQPFIKDNTQVYIDGVYQNKAGYSISGTTLTFSEAPPLNADIEIVVARSLTTAATDASNVNYTQGGTGSTNRTVESKLQEFVSVKDFGAVGDGVTDDTAAIQAALDSVPNSAGSYAPSKTSGGAGRVFLFFPNGDYKVTSTLDCSQRDYVQLVGEGRASIISTSTEYIIDMSSIDHCVMQNLRLYSATARVGIYLDRCTSNPFSQFNLFDTVTVYLTSDVTANSGNGRIGIWNGRGELNVYRNVEVRADLCMYVSKNHNTSFQPTNGTLDTSISSSVQNTYDACKWIPWTAHAPAILLTAGCLSHEFIGNYWGNGNTSSGTVPYAIIADGVSGCKFTGTVEVYPRFMLCRSAQNTDNTIDLMFQNNFDGSGIIDCINPSGTTGFSRGYVSIATSGAIASGTAVIKGSVTSSSNVIRGNIIKTISSLPAIITPSGQEAANIIQTEDSQVSINEQENNTTFWNSYRGSALLGTSVTENNLSLKGSPDDVGVEYARIHSGRDTTVGAGTYASYLAFYTESKSSGTTDTSTEKGRWMYDGTFRPSTDDTQSLGNASFKWSEVFAGTGTINTSDARKKQQRDGGIDPAVLRAWERVEYSQFKFNDAVALKGDNARWHIGVIAQRVKEAFEAEGLDPFEYGILCYDQWDEQWEETFVEKEVIETNEHGVEVLKTVREPIKKLITPAGDSYGIRYEEALALECAYLRSKLNGAV